MPIRRKIKNVVANYSAAELLVREATSNDPSLPDEYTLLKIADATKISYYYEETTRMIFKRLNDKSKNWRHIYKALLVIEVCLKNGSVAFVNECQHQAHQITTLSDFMFLGEDGTEASRLVREQTKRVSRLLADTELLREERKVARSQRHQIRHDYAYSRPRSLSTCSFDPHLPGKDRNVQRSCSYARNDAEEEEQIKMAIRLSVAELDEKTRNALQQQAHSENHNTNSDVDTLLDLSDSPPMTERERRGFDDWLASRRWKNNQPSQSETKEMPPVPGLTLKQRAEQHQLQQHLMQRKQAEQQQQQQCTTSTGDLDFLEIGITNQNTTAAAGTSSSASTANCSPGDAGSSPMGFFKPSETEPPSQKESVDPAAKFLGEHVNLINLDNLITPKPVCPVKSEPPKPSLFDLSSSTSQQSPFGAQPANLMNQSQSPFQPMGSQAYMQRSGTLQPGFGFQSSSGLNRPGQNMLPFSSDYASPMMAAGPGNQSNGGMNGFPAGPGNQFNGGMNGFSAGGPAQWTNNYGGAGTLQPTPTYSSTASAAYGNPFL